MKAPSWLQRGFTLIELLVTMAIAAILLVVAVPGMSQFMRNAELTSATNSLLGAINAARGEAIKRGMHAMVVPINGTDWNSGVLVFVDQNRDNAYVAADDKLIMTQAPLASYFTVTPSNNVFTVNKPGAPYIMFDPSGFARTDTGTVGVAAAGTLTIARSDLTGANLLEQTRRIVIAGTGRVRSCKPVSASDPQCLLTSTE